MDRLAPVLALLFVAAVSVLALRDGPGETPPGSPPGSEASDGEAAARRAASERAPARGTTAVVDALPAQGGDTGRTDVGPRSGGAAGGAPDAPGAGRPEAGPDVTVDRRRYTVSGSTARQLEASLRENGRRMEGHVAFAWTDWSVDVGYEYRRSDGSCRLVRPDVDVRIVVTLPEWTGRHGASADLVSRWRGDLATMEEHEQGHVELARRAGRRVYDTLREVEPAPCPLLRDRVDAAADAVLGKARRAQDAYDDRTDHGGDQDAARPPR